MKINWFKAAMIFSMPTLTVKLFSIAESELATKISLIILLIIGAIFIAEEKQ